MDEKLKALAAAIAEKQSAALALLDKDGRTPADLAAAKALTDEATTLQSEYATREALVKSQQFVTTPVSTMVHADPAADIKVAPTTPPAAPEPIAKAEPVPAQFKNQRTRYLKSVDEAYGFGQFIRAACFGHPGAAKWLESRGIDIKAQVNYDNSYGGFLVPEEYASGIIDLRESYGVARQYCEIVPMGSDSKSIRRSTGGLTAYAVGEGATGTESSATWDEVNLNARKWMVLADYTGELADDAVISIGDNLANAMAYAFAKTEDECLILGDGTSTYHGIVGIEDTFLNLTGTIANIAGLFVGTGNAYSELVLTDFESTVAKLPRYADTPNARWFMHKTFFWTVAMKLALAAGGVPAAEIINGQRTPEYLGYPVVFCQAMPAVEANSQVCAILGDMSMAVAFGDRAGLRIAYSAETDFKKDITWMRGIERFDINVHDVGNQSATAASRNPGPIVGLITAAA